jgi:hypothetical protein
MSRIAGRQTHDHGNYVLMAASTGSHIPHDLGAGQQLFSRAVEFQSIGGRLWLNHLGNIHRHHICTTMCLQPTFSLCSLLGMSRAGGAAFVSTYTRNIY